MAQENQDPGNPRELGEQFQFIAEVSDIISAENFVEPSDRVNLISTAGRFGIIFVAYSSSIRVFKTKDLIDKHEKVPIATIACRGPVTHVSTSCDGLTLFVVTIEKCCPFGVFYDVRHVMQMGREVVPFYSVPLNTNNESRVVSLSWNPCDPTCIALALTTGDLSLIKIKDSSVEFTNNNGVGANALTWSAKGKQLAVGMKDATMSLFKPDLTLVRSIPAPSVQDVGPIFDITWFTNTEFFIGYLTKNVGPALMYVNAPKGKAPAFVNFDDVCYSIESDKPVSYYSVFVSEWNILFVFSSNGEEMAVIGRTENENDPFNWCLWSPDEGGKAVMHHYNVLEETYPLGLVIDFTSERTFPSKDETTKGPFPFLATVSTKGELNVFFIENYLANPTGLNVQSENLPLSGHRTPEQFGQPTSLELPPNVTETPPSELKQNFLSAFSSIPKKTESPAPTPLLFSTPIKSTFPAPTTNMFSSTNAFSTTPTLSFQAPSSQGIKASSQPFSITGAATNTFSLTSASTASPTPTPTPTPSSNLFTLSSTNAPNFSSSLISKPVTLSSQIGTASLPAPSPQKSEIFQLLPSSFPTSSVPTSSVASQPKPSSLLPQATLPPPSPKLSRESVLYHIQREEQLFKKELQELRTSINVLEKEIGKDKDLDLKVSIEKIKEWMKAMESNTQEQSDEVGNLHQKTLETLALYEDANSHRQLKFSSRNEIYNQLRPLDPYSQRKLDEVRFKYRYLVSQINEVNTKLDLQWEEIAALRKPKRDQRSSTDNLYRSVLNLHTVRVSAEKELDRTIQQLKKLNISPVISSGSFNLGTNSRSENLRDILNDSTNAVPSQSPSQNRSSSDRNRQLKEILSQRNHTPVRVHSVDVPDASVKNKENIKLENVNFSKSSSPFGNKSQCRPLYEDISPSTSRPQPGNPLAALSSLVGKVSAPETSSTITDSTVSASLKADSTSVSSFAFAQKKQSLPTLQANVKKEVPSVNSLFGNNASQNVMSSQQVPSISSSLFAVNKGPSVQGFSGAFTSQQSNLNSSITTVPISTGSKSPLLDILSINKSPSEHNSFAQFFKGVAPASISSTSSSSLFSSPVESRGSKNNASFTQGLVTSLGGLASASSGSLQNSSTPEMAVKVSVKQDETKSVATVKGSSLSTKDTNVLNANPILSSHILKETSSIVSSGSLQGNILGNFGMTSSLFSQGSKPSGISLIKESSDSTGLFSVPISAAPQPSLVSQSTTTTASIFTPSTNSSSIFGKPTSGTTIFGQSIPNTSMFGQSTTNVILNQPAVNTSIFGLPTTTNSSVASLIGEKSVISGSTAPTTSTVSTQSGVQSSVNSLIFSQSQTNNSTKLFGGQTATISTEVPSTSSHADSLTTTATTQNVGTGSSGKSLFSNETTSLFGKSNNNIFLAEGKPAATSTTVSLDSNVSTNADDSKEKLMTPSLFNPVTSASVASQVVSNSSSIFGAPAGNKSVFGQVSSTQPVSSSGSLLSLLITKDDKNSSSVDQTETSVPAFSFGATSSASAPSQNIFGGGSVASTTSTTTTTTSQGIFGGTFPANTTSTFGNSGTPISSTQSVFGGGLPLGTGSTFGTPASTSQNVFGGSSANSNSIFGKPVSETSVFGSSSTNQSVFGGGGNAPAFQNSSGSIFGQTNTSAPSGGTASTSAGSVFGNQPAPSPFGQPPQNSSIFGNNAAQPTDMSKSIFGGTNVPSTATSVFGTNNSNSTLFSQGFAQNSNNSLFSSDNMLSGLGKAPSTEDSSKNVFGAVKSGIPTQTNIFGGGGSNNSSFGAFSSQKQTGAFSPVKPGPAFGSAPIFGGSPNLGDTNKPQSIFGGNPIFGGSPIAETKSVFGSNATFGSSGNAAGGFSSFASSGGPTFGTLANQSGSSTGSGFGQLSQQNNPGMQNTDSSLGGSSFTSWR